MTPEEKYELFERKIGNDLSDDEEKELSTILEEDAQLAEEFKLYNEWNSYLKSNLDIQKESELERNIKVIGDSFFDKKPRKKETKVIRIPSWGYAIAASIAIILGIYTFTKNDPVYSDFVSIPALSIAERGTEDEILKKAEMSFNSESYEDSEKYLLELLEKDQNNSEYLFYLGISLLEQNKHAKASEVFERLIKGTSVYQNRAIWFEALNQLKQKNTDRCKYLLKQIPKDAEDYQQAQKLLRKL
ncbi:tol-pal system YbgF family protein [Aquimarina sp. SS2-1]|uniref:tetratricopeptide repeat protein n=1 Tax=Aquimarina besae TaxID=3342247 RepID=UPI00366F48CB